MHTQSPFQPRPCLRRASVSVAGRAVSHGTSGESESFVSRTTPFLRGVMYGLWLGGVSYVDVAEEVTKPALSCEHVPLH